MNRSTTLPHLSILLRALTEPAGNHTAYSGIRISLGVMLISVILAIAMSLFYAFSNLHNEASESSKTMITSPLPVQIAQPAPKQVRSKPQEKISSKKQEKLQAKKERDMQYDFFNELPSYQVDVPEYIWPPKKPKQLLQKPLQQTKQQQQAQIKPQQETIPNSAKTIRPEPLKPHQTVQKKNKIITSQKQSQSSQPTKIAKRTHYQIQVGNYPAIAQAKAMQKRLLRLGIRSQISSFKLTNNKTRFRVLIRSSGGNAQLKRTLKQLKAQHINAFIQKASS